jgi:putrescine aminotransferase
MAMAKGMSSGYLPIGGVMVADTIAQAMIEGGGEFFHGYTYAGHPTCCAVAERNIRIIRDERLVERVREDTGPYLQRRWRELENHPLVGEARGIGFIGALELVRDKATRARFDPLGEVGTLCRDFCFDNGLVMRAVWDTMIISPPLVMTRTEIDELIDRAHHCLDLTARALGLAC